MKFIRTDELDQQEFEAFFEEMWDDLEDHRQLKEHGYLIEQDGKYQAYFALCPVDSRAVWLKSLYMKQGASSSLPLTIIESASKLAQEIGAKDLFVFSHQKTLDSLLSLLQFRSEETPAFANDVNQSQHGKWWNLRIPTFEDANS